MIPFSTDSPKNSTDVTLDAGESSRQGFPRGSSCHVGTTRRSRHIATFGCSVRHPARVILPQDWLADRDSDVVTEGAELDDSGG
jgi:hypothetical protein